MLNELKLRILIKFIIMIMLMYLFCVYVSETKLSNEKCIVISLLSGTILVLLDYYSPVVIKNQDNEN